MTTHKARLPLLAYGALALSMALVGANVPLMKYLGTHLSIVWIGIVRSAIALPAVAPWLLLLLPRLRGRATTKLRRGDAARFPPPSTGSSPGHTSPASGGGERRFLAALEIAALGLAGIFFYPLLLLLGLKTTSAFSAGAIAATLPAMVALLSMLLLREHLGLRAWAGVGAAVGAILFLRISSAHGGIGGNLSGLSLVLAAVLAEAFYVILSKRVARHTSPAIMTLGANLAGLAAFLVLGATTGKLGFPEAPPLAWVGALWFGLSSSVLALLLMFWGVARVPASHVGVFSVFLPISAGLISVLTLGERPGFAALFGLLLALAAIWLTATAPRADESGYRAAKLANSAAPAVPAPPCARPEE
jgi:drug/metabolite transporter (DMT)-like permease